MKFLSWMFDDGISEDDHTTGVAKHAIDEVLARKILANQFV